MRIRRGWELTRRSWALVRRDRRLLVFPCAGAAVGTALGAAIVYWGTGRARWGYVAAAAVLSFPATLLGSYFGLAFVAVARRALDGEPFRLRRGFRCANARVPALVARSAIATGAVLVLQVLLNLGGGWLAGTVASWLFGMAWAAAAFLVIPILAFEDVGPAEAVRRSARLVKRRWGEAAAGVTVIGGLLALVLLHAAGAIGVAAAFWPAAGAKIAIAVVAVAIAFQTATTQLFQLVLYRYATTGEVASGFAAANRDRAFRHRRRGLLRRRKGR